MTDTTDIAPRLPPGYVLKYSYEERGFSDWVWLGAWVGKVHFPARHVKGFARSFGSNSGFVFAHTEAGIIRKARRIAWREARARHKHEQAEITVSL